MMNAECFRDGKRIDLRLRKRKGLDKSTNVRCGLFLPIILHLNVEGLSARSALSAIGRQTLVVLLQETHYTNANLLVIPYFTLVGSQAGSMAWLGLSTRNLAGPLGINPRRDQQLSA